uniref:Uncharacterized protein n=1 Tax=Trichuris muris TaxID=70415 RepID=A0A5S6QHQ0_TRIMR
MDACVASTAIGVCLKPLQTNCLALKVFYTHYGSHDVSSGIFLAFTEKKLRSSHQELILYGLKYQKLTPSNCSNAHVSTVDGTWEAPDGRTHSLMKHVSLRNGNQKSLLEFLITLATTSRFVQHLWSESWKLP